MSARPPTPAEVGRHYGASALRTLGARKLPATSRGQGWPQDWGFIEEKCGRPLSEQDRAEAQSAYFDALCEPGGAP